MNNADSTGGTKPERWTDPSLTVIRRRVRVAVYATLAALLLAGAVTRILGSWWQRHTHNPDFGIVALMAKHMAEGRDFPVFFYGQAYMGSLEPMVSALFCRVMGFSGFAVCLGAALVGFLCLPLLFRWGREAGGVAAGLTAVAFCTVGPGAYFHYQVSPRGGYPLTLLLTVLILWLSVNIAFREKERLTVSGWRWFLLGLAAGVGWWTNQLIAPAIMTAAVVFLVALRWRVFSWKLLPGAAGFAVGSAPFWVWNMRNGWESFAFLDSLSHSSPRAALILFFRERFRSMFDMQLGPPEYRQAVLALYLATGLLVLILLARRLWRNGLNRRSLHLLAVLTYGIFLTLSFISSHYAFLNTPRYLLPLVPVMAVVFGVTVAVLARGVQTLVRRGLPRGLPATVAGLVVTAIFAFYAWWWCCGNPMEPGRAELGRITAIAGSAGVLALLLTWRLPALVAFTPVFALIVFHADSLRHFRTTGLAGNAWMRDVGTPFVQTLKEANVRAVYTVYEDHALNYLFNEQYIFSDMKGERYRPYAEFCEQQDSVAVLNNYGRVDSFLATAGGTARLVGADRPYVYCDFAPPEKGYRELEPGLWASASNAVSTNLLAALTDRNVATRWQCGQAINNLNRLEIRFRATQTVARIRLVSDRLRYPDIWEIEGLKDGRWTSINGPMGATGFYWSGPRPYFGGMMYRLETRFAPVEVEALRLRLVAGNPVNVEVSELELFGPADAPVAERSSLPALLALIRERGIQSLYADRWVANAVRRETGGAVETPREPAIYRLHPPNSNVTVRLTPQTALLVRTEDAPASRQALEACRITLRETPVGPWVLMDVAPGQWKEDFGRHFALHWAGFGCFLGGNEKRRALSLLEDGRTVRAAGGDTTTALARVEEALRVYPNCRPAVEQLAAWYGEAGDTEKARAFGERAAAMWTPRLAAPATFGDGLALLGVDIPGTPVTPGTPFTTRYYWRCDPDARLENVVAFVHFSDGKTVRFQDDHAVLAVHDVANQPFPEVFVEDRVVTVPSHTPPGSFQMVLGVYDASRSNLRRRPATSLPTHMRAVTLPVIVTVTSK